MGALDGIVVIALEQAVAAPYCTSRLAQAGARVIKIERPEGDFARGYDRAVGGLSSYFVWLNAGKESIALNLKDAGDLALLERMLARADVFVQNFAPGAVERLGLGPARLEQISPRLITCAITGYGTSGPYAEMKAYDLLIQAESALCAVTGGPEAPSRVGVSVVDIGTGMQAYAAILNALIGAAATAGAGASTCRCSTAPPNGWRCRCCRPAMAARRPPASASPIRPSRPTARSGPATAARW